jgi:hypothetical protein
MLSPSRLGWLALPAFLAVLVLIGLGVSTEGRSDFERRTTDAGEEGNGDGADGQEVGPIEEQDQTAQPQPSDGAQPADGFQNPAEGQELAEITVATETGELIIQLDENSQPIRLTPVGPDGTGESVQIDPDDLVAVRLGDDGQLEVIPLDEVGPDDTIVTPADGGFDLRRPDGSLVEFRGDGENGGITATEVDRDGATTELEPNEDGSVTLSDGTTVGPIDVVDELGPVERLIERTRQLPWPYLAAGLVLLVAGSVALALFLRRRSSQEFDLSQLASAGVPEGRFNQFLDSLRHDPDPSRAIRVGFSVAERGLGGVPTRRADETPFEWHRRVSEGGSPVATTLGQICDLFARARFAPGQSTENDRVAMLTALEELHRQGRTVTDDGASTALDHAATPERQDA